MIPVFNGVETECRRPQKADTFWQIKMMQRGNEMSAIIKEMLVKSVIAKSNLPVCNYSVNPYVGCTHACKYFYASFMKRFTEHTEP